MKNVHLNFKHLLQNDVRYPNVGAQKRGAEKNSPASPSETRFSYQYRRANYSFTVCRIVSGSAESSNTPSTFATSRSIVAGWIDRIRIPIHSLLDLLNEKEENKNPRPRQHPMARMPMKEYLHLPLFQEYQNKLSYQNSRDLYPMVPLKLVRVKESWSI